MRVLKKIGTEQYIEVDTDLDRPMTSVMTRVQAYFYLLKHQIDDLAVGAIEWADHVFEQDEKEVS